MPDDLLISVGYLIARYLHIVCTTLLVGGTLFYEMVVPVAIADLKEEQQLAVFARARWVFKRLVWTSVILLILSGVISTQRHWEAYSAPEMDYATLVVPGVTDPVEPPVAALRAGWWWVAHASTGLIASLIALSLTAGPRPPTHPIQWMRLNLVILMIVIFLASSARQVRMMYADRQAEGMPRAWIPLPALPPPPPPSTQPEEP